MRPSPTPPYNVVVVVVVGVVVALVCVFAVIVAATPAGALVPPEACAPNKRAHKWSMSENLMQHCKGGRGRHVSMRKKKGSRN